MNYKIFRYPDGTVYFVPVDPGQTAEQEQTDGNEQ
jgi:hypothetical protein